MEIYKFADKYMLNLIKIMSSRTGYIGLFKAFISIVTLLLISTFTLFEVTRDLEFDSNRLKYIVEHELEKQIVLKDFECSFEIKSYPECQLAKDKHEVATIGLAFFELNIKFLTMLAYITGCMSIIAFFSNPLIHRAVPYRYPPKT